MLKKRSSTTTLIVMIGLILVIATFFPLGKIVAKTIGILGVDNTAESYYKINKSISMVSTKAEGTSDSQIIDLDEDTAIMGFSKEAEQIEILRWGTNFKFPRPASCPLGVSCLCGCRKAKGTAVPGTLKLMHDYACEEEMQCVKYENVDFLNFMDEDEFGTQEWNSYGYKGGFIIMRSTFYGKESWVFDVPPRIVMYIQKGEKELIGVCFKQDCLSEEMQRRETEIKQAYSIFNKAEELYIQPDFKEAKKFYDAIITDENVVNTFKNVSPDILNIVYFKRALIEYQDVKDGTQKDYDAAKQTIEKSVDETSDKSIKKELQDKIKVIECDYEKQECSCYTDEDLCEESKLNCCYELESTSEYEVRAVQRYICEPKPCEQ